MSNSERASEWDVRAPKGWGPVAEVCRAMHDNVSEVAAGINATIEQTIPAFAPSESPFTREDRFLSSRGLIAGFLHAVAEDRAINEREAAFARLVGQRSALKGFPLPPLIDSLYTAYRELWAMLVEEADRAGGRSGELLRDAGATIWERMHATTTAVTAGYHRQMPRPEALEVRIATQFVKALASSPESDECRSLAIDLGFNPEGSFRIVALTAPVAPVEVARGIAADVHARGGVAVAAARGGGAILVLQGADASPAGIAAGAPAGVGLEGEGLDGARASLAEAECALRFAQAAGGVRSFTHDWFLAAPMMLRPSMERMLGEGIALARRKPHLADAVRAFASSGFSLVSAAAELAVTQSTVRYRLKRWHALTAWDPWTFDGLAHSMMALQLASASASAAD